MSGIVVRSQDSLTWFLGEEAELGYVHILGHFLGSLPSEFSSSGLMAECLTWLAGIPSTEFRRTLGLLLANKIRLKLAPKAICDWLSGGTWLSFLCDPLWWPE